VRTDFSSIGCFFPEGKLDAGFGEDGYLVGVGSRGAMASAPDGRILVASVTSFSGDEVQVSRFGPDGTVDRSYGEAGSTTIRMQENAGAIAGLLAEPGGALVVGSATDKKGHVRIEVARLLLDGSIDRSYGENGFAVVQLPDSILPHPVLHPVALEGGRLTLALSGGRADVLIVRIDADGSLDPSLGGTGMVMDKPLEGVLADVATLPDGRIEIVSNLPMVVRLMPDGSPDMSFGDGGRVTLPALKGRQTSAIALQSDGSVFLGGSVLDPTSRESDAFFLARLDPDGALDPTLGGEGIAATDLGSAPGTRVEALDLALMPNGDAVLVGKVPPREGPATAAAIGIAAFTPGGDLDPAFGEAGIVVARPMEMAQDSVADVLAARGGAIVTGRAAGQILLAKYSRKGRPEPDFPAARAVAALRGGYHGTEGLSLTRYPDGGFLLGTASGEGAALLPIITPSAPQHHSFGHVEEHT
jgi:uncharacterized delta-60 repeat protein